VSFPWRLLTSSAAAQIAGAKAQINTLEAQIVTARINLGYTQIAAPVTGHVTQRSAAPGNYVTPGQDLMTIVPLQLWVTANFKETQLARMHRGQEVTIHIDTFGRNYRGYVEQMPGASGDRFSLLPPENATGNYVKVVQRLPVRILFEPGQDPDHQLHPGMSVEPTVWLPQSHRQ